MDETKHCILPILATSRALACLDQIKGVQVENRLEIIERFLVLNG